jgi:hypothetical protein
VRRPGCLRLRKEFPTSPVSHLLPLCSSFNFNFFNSILNSNQGKSLSREGSLQLAKASQFCKGDLVSNSQRLVNLQRAGLAYRSWSLADSVNPSCTCSNSEAGTTFTYGEETNPVISCYKAPEIGVQTTMVSTPYRS